MMKVLRTKSKYYDAILSHRKTIEVRVGFPNITNLRTGQRVELKTHDRYCVAIIRGVRIYASFEHMLEVEDPSMIFPGENSQGVLKILREIYSGNKEELGVYVFEVEPE